MSRRRRRPPKLSLEAAAVALLNHPETQRNPSEYIWRPNCLCGLCRGQLELFSAQEPTPVGPLDVWSIPRDGPEAHLGRDAVNRVS